MKFNKNLLIYRICIWNYIFETAYNEPEDTDPSDHKTCSNEIIKEEFL